MIDHLIESEEWRWVLIASGLLLFAISLPFIWAYVSGSPGYQFMGVLVNPIDGATYQAKMVQGFSGSWLFQLKHTPEPHQGAFVFTFYLMLGHIARVLGLPAILVFHTARLLGSMIMFLTIYQLIAYWTANVQQRRLTWMLAIFGSGFGWITLAAGMIPYDILILPEAFPLQSAYANPHFTWSIALAMWIVSILVDVSTSDSISYPTFTGRTAGLALASLILASTSLFVLIPIGVGYGVLLLWLWYTSRKFPLEAFAWGCVILVFCLPFIIYSAFVFSPDNPVFFGWWSQNNTPSPPVWEYLLAFGPIIILAFTGVWGSRHKLDKKDIFLLGWIAGIAVLLYIPFNLQRRFSMGMLIPLAIFAGRGLWRVLLPSIPEKWQSLTTISIFALFMPTTIFAIVLPLVGTLNPADNPLYYLSHQEQEALQWMDDNIEPSSVILASPEIGLYIPISGHRVVYGHPFETVNDEARRQAVQDYYQGLDCSVVVRESVDYVMLGSYERRLSDGGSACPIEGELIYQTSGDDPVEIYRLP